jgi:carboxylesterase
VTGSIRETPDVPPAVDRGLDLRDGLVVTSPSAFETAQSRVKQLAKTPTSEELLELYALFKQGTQGDVSGARPGMMDFKGRAKFDAWAQKKGMSRDAAARAYVDLVERLAARYGTNP